LTWQFHQPVLILDGGLDAITAPPNGELVARSLSQVGAYLEHFNTHRPHR
jgi:hypothetical protein